jgi:hypothetical protein
MTVVERVIVPLIMSEKLKKQRSFDYPLPVLFLLLLVLLFLVLVG